MIVMAFLSKNLKYLRKQKGYTQQDFANAIGIKRSLVGSYEEERAEPRLSYLQSMADFLGVSVDQLIGEDLTVQSSAAASTHASGKGMRVLSVTVNDQGEESIELVPQKAAAGYLDGYADPEFIEELPRFRIPGLRGGTYRAFEISGDSMLPLTSGTIIIGQYKEDWYQVKDGHVCVLVTLNEGVVFKRVYNRIAEHNSLLLVSDNQDYTSYEVPVEEVLELWEAVRYLSDEFPEPENTSLQELTRMVKELQQEVRALKTSNRNG